MSHLKRQLSFISDILINVVVACVPPDYEISHVEGRVESKDPAFNIVDS